jgi:site-specific recombinase XerD
MPFILCLIQIGNGIQSTDNHATTNPSASSASIVRLESLAAIIARYAEYLLVIQNPFYPFLDKQWEKCQSAIFHPTAAPGPSYYKPQQQRHAGTGYNQKLAHDLLRCRHRALIHSGEPRPKRVTSTIPMLSSLRRHRRLCRYVVPISAHNWDKFFTIPLSSENRRMANNRSSSTGVRMDSLHIQPENIKPNLQCQPPNLSVIIPEFFEACRASRYSPHTLAEYQNTYKKFLNSTGDLPVSEITARHIRQFLANQTTISAKTLLNYHTGLSSLWHWMVKNEIVPVNVVRMIDPARPEQREIIPLSRAEIERMIAAAQIGENAARDHAILLVLLDSGIRASELVGLRVGDMDSVERRLLVMGKGRKERRVKICQSTFDMIEHYLHTRSKNIRHLWNERMFITSTGQPMTRDTLRQIMDRIKQRSGVPHVHAHRVRHTFAINFLRNGGNIYTLQKILGHTTLEMCKRYLQIAQSDLDKDHDRASPVANWNL